VVDARHRSPGSAGNFANAARNAAGVAAIATAGRYTRPSSSTPGWTWISACVGSGATRGIAGRRHLAQALADHQQHVGIADARGQRRIDGDATSPT